MRLLLLSFCVFFLHSIYAQDSLIYYDYRKCSKEEIKQNEDTINIISKIIQQFSDSSLLYTYRGYYYIHANKPSLAKADFFKAIAIDATNSKAYCDLAWMFYAEENDEEAIELYKKYLALEPTDSSIIFLVGVLYSRHSDKNKAIDYLLRISTHPLYGMKALTSLGFCYSELGDNTNSKFYYDKALISINERIKDDATDSYAYLLRAYVHKELNDYATVLADYDKSISLDSTSREVYFFKGLAEKAMSKTKESCDNFYKATVMGYGSEASDLLCENCKSLCRKYKEEQVGTPRHKSFRYKNDL